jgi:alkyl hydroperoxide reductase subunit AhpC
MSDIQTEANCALPRLDEPAPYFEARSTHGVVKLTDFRGKWLVFFAHPADFTPVCASEFVAFANDEGVLRAMLWYPGTTGRSVSEVLRLVQALQTADRLHVVTPEGWKPGEDTLEHPPDRVADTEVRRDLAYGCVDWYYVTRPATGE